MAPQSTAGVGVAGSSVANVQLAGGRVAPGFPRTREAGPTYIVEHLEQVDADGKRMSPWCKCEYMHMYDRVGREKLLFTNMDKESSDWLTSNEGPRDGADLRIDTRTVAQMVESGEIDKSRVCLLDMRGEKALCPEDADSLCAPLALSPLPLIFSSEKSEKSLYGTATMCFLAGCLATTRHKETLLGY